MSRPYEEADKGKKFAILDVSSSLWTSQGYGRSKDQLWGWTLHIGHFPPGLVAEKMKHDSHFFYCDLQSLIIKSPERYATKIAAWENAVTWYSDLFDNPPMLVTVGGNPVQKLLF